MSGTKALEKMFNMLRRGELDAATAIEASTELEALKRRVEALEGLQRCVGVFFEHGRENQLPAGVRMAYEALEKP